MSEQQRKPRTGDKGTRETPGRYAVSEARRRPPTVRQAADFVVRRHSRVLKELEKR